MKPLIGYLSMTVVIILILCAGCSDDGSRKKSSSVFDSFTKDQEPPVAGKSITVKKIDSQTVTVTWEASSDDTTSDKNLQYKLVLSKNNNIGTVEDAERNGRTVMGWTPGTLTRQVKGISPSSIYYFTALVRDDAGNVAVYMPQRLSSPDSNPPVVKGSLAFSNISKDSLLVTWPPAVDDVTSQENLQYKLLYMPPNSMRMVVDAENNGTMIMDWTANMRSRQVSGIQPVNSYYFVVMVKDEAGNRASYPPQKPSASDTRPPDADMGVYVSEVNDRNATVSWNLASDDITPQDKLQYKVVYSKNRDIYTAQDAEAHGQTALGWTANVTSHKVKGLEPSTTYYFVTIVKDEAGNTSIYDVENVITQHDSGKSEEEDKEYEE